MTKWFIAVTCILLLGLPAGALAAELGVRGGTDATGTARNYSAAELYLLYPLPWQWDALGGTLRPRLDGGVTWLESGGDHGGWLAAGADLIYSVNWLPLELEAGFRPAWLFETEYGREDFGGAMQFISHVGATLRIAPFALSYRFQHLSNAGIYAENPGLNLHLFGVGASF
jgi:lipid A 3-O-deacylase